MTTDTGLGGGCDTDSTKRLYTYTFPENGSKYRKSKLAKKPGQYFGFAQTISTLLDEPEEPYLCRIFEGCSFGTGAENLPDWESYRWVKLARMISQMADSVIRDTDLHRYWQEVMMLNGDYDVRSGRFRHSTWPLDKVGCSLGLAGDRLFSGETLPAPSVFLGKRPQMEPIDSTLEFGDGSEMDVTLRLWLEVRLALAPVNSEGRIGPLLEFRSVLDAISDDFGKITFDNPFADGSGGSDTIKSALVGGHEIPISQFPILDAPQAEFRMEAGHGYFAWEEVSPALLKKLFGDFERPLETMSRRSGVYLGNVPANRFETGTPAADLHCDLLTGVLEEELAATCLEMIENFDRFRIDSQELIEKAEAEAEARWSRPSATST